MFLVSTACVTMQPACQGISAQQEAQNRRKGGPENRQGDSVAQCQWSLSLDIDIVLVHWFIDWFIDLFLMFLSFCFFTKHWNNIACVFCIWLMTSIFCFLYNYDYIIVYYSYYMIRSDDLLIRFDDSMINDCRLSRIVRILLYFSWFSWTDRSVRASGVEGFVSHNSLWVWVRSSQSRIGPAIHEKRSSG